MICCHTASFQDYAYSPRLVSNHVLWTVHKIITTPKRTVPTTFASSNALVSFAPLFVVHCFNTRNITGGMTKAKNVWHTPPTSPLSNANAGINMPAPAAVTPRTKHTPRRALAPPLFLSLKFN
mmetsp:Transcript_28146/g.61314  ORF Transcript_28146/g.61314 Transcript_28146/m.61314 type:complete len:123 (-) Transcript_28146:91-459(-)